MFYYPTLAFLWMLSLLPDFILYLISDLFYLLCFEIMGYRKQVVADNLHNSFPEKAEREIHQITASFYRSFCDTIIEMIKIMFCSERELRKMVEFRNVELLNKLHEQGRSLIVVQGHYFNWELSLMMGGESSKHDRYVIYKIVNSKLSEKLILRLRARFGNKMLVMHKTLEYIATHSSKTDNNPALFQFGADQSPIQHKIEYWTTFMNQETPFFLGPEKLAVANNMPVVYLDLQKTARGKYCIEFSLIEEYPAATAQYEITEKYVKKLEAAIYKNPSNWLWSHKRWKHKRL